MSILEGIRGHFSLFGPYGVFAAAKARLLRRPLEIKVEVAGISHPVHLRLRTSDVSLFDEIIVNAEYAWESFPSPRVIVDAGANAGLTSVFYANRYRGAKIIAVEPEPSNFALLKKNVTPYPNIIAVQAALWKENIMLSIHDPGRGKWGFQTRNERESNNVRVRGLTLDRLMDEYDCSYIDILKIDIEGSEKELFENPAPWVDKVGMIVIELHDHFKAGCSSSVYSGAKDFQIASCKGETTILLRK
ncbi:MAG: FkbM family methyltransferase [Candidatus Dormibacteria bacterium]